MYDVLFDFSDVVHKHALHDKDLVTIKQSSDVESTSFLLLSVRFVKIISSRIGVLLF